jgi:hypothetical protein
MRTTPIAISAPPANAPIGSAAASRPTRAGETWNSPLPIGASRPV